MKSFQALLVKLRLFDPDNTLSLTSILLMVAIARMAIFPADMYTIGILTLALAHANAKRFSAHKAKVHAGKKADLEATDKAKLELMEAEVKKLINNANLNKLGR